MEPQFSVVTVTKYLEALRGFRLFADLGGYTSSPSCFRRFRPDVVLKKNKEIIVNERIVCYEANTQKNNEYKRKKYSDLGEDIIVECENLRLVLLEVTSHGFITNNIKDFKVLARDLKLGYNRLIEKCAETGKSFILNIYKKIQAVDEPCLI